MIRVIGDQSQRRRYSSTLAQDLNEKSQSQPGEDLSKAESQEESRTENVDLSNFIRLPGKTSDEDMLVSLKRLQTPATWEKAHQRFSERGGIMLNLYQFIDFLKVLKSGNAQDVNGDRVDPAQLEKSYNNILNQSGEWIDAVLFNNSPTLILEYNHFFHKGTKTVYSQKGFGLDNGALLGPHVISIENWLHSNNSQGGLPTKGAPEYHVFSSENLDALIYKVPELKPGCRIPFMFTAKSGKRTLSCEPEAVSHDPRYPSRREACTRDAYLLKEIK